MKDREENTKIIEENKFKKKNGKSSITAHGVWIHVYISTFMYNEKKRKIIKTTTKATITTQNE